MDYITSNVEEVEKQEVQPEEKGNKDEEEGEGEKNKVCEGREEYIEEEPDLEEEEVDELLPFFLCKGDMKTVTKDGKQMLFCSTGAVCTPPFTMPATYLALREMSKAVHPSYLHTKKGTTPHYYKHSIPIASANRLQNFADPPVFECAVRAGGSPLTNREDSSFVKCSNGLFGDMANLAKAQNNYKRYQA